MNKINSGEVEIKNEIMATTIFIKLLSTTKSQIEIEQDIQTCIQMFKDFEEKYSRFISNNILDNFNNSTEGKLTPEFFNILNLSQKFNKDTQGIFDIGVLSIIKNEGYNVSKSKGFIDPNQINEKSFISVDQLVLNSDLSYKKPIDLKIDIGGIGKGYIVDKVTEFLRKSMYDNFVVDAGGDIRFEGENEEDNLKFWVSGVENPNILNEDIFILKLKNKSIATSGINKRVWKKDGETKNHIINIEKKESLVSDNLTCTVITNTTTEADVYAKYLLILDLNSAISYADNNKISVLIIDKNSKVEFNNLFKEYIYEI